MNSFLIWDKYDNTYKTVVDIKEVNQLQEIINLMAEHIKEGCDFDNRIQTKQQILEYFTNKAVR